MQVTDELLGSAVPQPRNIHDELRWDLFELLLLFVQEEWCGGVRESSLMGRMSARHTRIHVSTSTEDTRQNWEAKLTHQVVVLHAHLHRDKDPEVVLRQVPHALDVKLHHVGRCLWGLLGKAHFTTQSLVAVFGEIPTLVAYMY